MQTANVMVNIGGDAGNQVPKAVTASEIAVLRAIHGPEAVSNIEPTDDIDRTNRDELARLRETYGRATDGENHNIVGILFPGAGARVFETIDELGLPEILFKPTSRASAKPAAVVADAPADEPVKKTRKGKKADAEPEAEAPVVDDDGGVAEMADADNKLFA